MGNLALIILLACFGFGMISAVSIPIVSHNLLKEKHTIEYKTMAKRYEDTIQPIIDIGDGIIYAANNGIKMIDNVVGKSHIGIRSKVPYCGVGNGEKQCMLVRRNALINDRKEAEKWTNSFKKNIANIDRGTIKINNSFSNREKFLKWAFKIK